ncbi:hypothetical protein [Bacillus sp. FSL K6-3431]
MEPSLALLEFGIALRRWDRKRDFFKKQKEMGVV